MNSTQTKSGIAGAGRNRSRPQIPMVPISFAKQAKPREEALEARFRDLSPDAVRITRHKDGTIEEEVLFNGAWLTAVQAGVHLASKKAEIAFQRTLNRAPARIGKILHDKTDYDNLSPAEQHLLHLTQREYSFRESAAQKIAGADNVSPVTAQAAAQGTVKTVPGPFPQKGKATISN
jgi:hypothetical protein